MGLSEKKGNVDGFQWEAVCRLVDYATVYPDGRVVFTFRNRVEVSTEI